MSKKDKTAEESKDVEIKQEGPKTPDTPVSNVRSFFTKEINDQIAEMGPKEMESILKGLIESREFIAILKYSSLRTPLLDATLRSTDPLKEASKISWAQGALAGLSDLETYIIELNAPKSAEEQESESTENKQEGVIIG